MTFVRTMINTSKRPNQVGNGLFSLSCSPNSIHRSCRGSAVRPQIQAIASAVKEARTPGAASARRVRRRCSMPPSPIDGRRPSRPPEPHAPPLPSGSALGSQPPWPDLRVELGSGHDAPAAKRRLLRATVPCSRVGTGRTPPQPQPQPHTMRGARRRASLR